MLERNPWIENGRREKKRREEKKKCEHFICFSLFIVPFIVSLTEVSSDNDKGEDDGDVTWWLQGWQM